MNIKQLILTGILGLTICTNASATRCIDNNIKFYQDELRSMGIDINFTRSCKGYKHRREIVAGILERYAHKLWLATSNYEGIKEARKVWSIHNQLQTYGYSYGFRSRQLLR